MEKIHLRTEKSPVYCSGDAFDFQVLNDQQQFHVDARCRHNKALHGAGIITGLEVVLKEGRTVTVKNGVAIDGSGRELWLPESTDITVDAKGAKLQLVLAYEDDGRISTKPTTPPRHERALELVIAVADQSEQCDGVQLATLETDPKGLVIKDTISPAPHGRATAPQERRGDDVAPVPPPQEDKAGQGEATLQRGGRVPSKEWLTFSFVPAAQNAKPFVLGQTQTASQESAEGIMAIPLPPGVTRITGMRVAGRRNTRGITITLFRGGWDRPKKQPLNDTVLNRTIAAAEGNVPFYQPFDLDQEFDAEWHTLSLSIKANGQTAISLVAIEVEFA